MDIFQIFKPPLPPGSASASGDIWTVLLVAPVCGGDLSITGLSREAVYPDFFKFTGCVPFYKGLLRNILGIYFEIKTQDDRHGNLFDGYLALLANSLAGSLLWKVESVYE